MTEIIKSRPPPSTPLDGSLFLVRHLLILKEVARRVGLSTSGDTSSDAPGGKQSGFGALPPTPAIAGSMAGTLSTMLNRTTSILPEGLFASLGVPRADDNLRDVKHVRGTSCFPVHLSDTLPGP